MSDSAISENSSLIRAAFDLRRSAYGFQRFLAQFDIDDSLVTRLLLRRDVAVFDGIFNGPLGTILEKPVLTLQTQFLTRLS